MAKKGMKRPDDTQKKEKNSEKAVPELQGKAKNSSQKANSVLETSEGEYKVWHEKAIPSAYKDIDNDLAVENLENDIPEADKRGS